MSDNPNLPREPDESDEPEEDIMSPVDLTREVFAEGGDIRLLCCSTAKEQLHVPAADIVYELTSNTGRVDNGSIVFDVGDDKAIRIDLGNGGFTIIEGDRVIGSGRKGLELLMLWRGMTFDDALAWVSSTYSRDKAHVMGIEYVTMKVAADELSANNP